MQKSLLILIALLSCLSGGCAKRTVYLEGGHKLTRLQRGQSAPREGILISEEYLSQIFEALNGQTPARGKGFNSPCAGKNCPQPE